MEEALKLPGELHRVKEAEKEPMRLSSGEWWYATGFLLSMSMMGLRFPLGYLLVIVYLIDSFKRRRNDFLIQFTIAFGGCGFYHTSAFPFTPHTVLLVTGVVCFFLVKRTPLIKKIFWSIIVYFAILVGFALMSQERMGIQVLMMRRYMYIVFLFIPLALFANRDFDILYFFKLLIGYLIIICVFYIIDCCVFCGWVLLPGLPVNGFPSWTKFYEPQWEPLMFSFPRKYPQGLYFLALAIYPVIRWIRLQPWQWLIIGVTGLLTRTMTFLAGLVATYVVFIGQGKKLLLYTVIAVITVSVLYYIDEETMDGNLRVASTVRQFAGLNFEDEEDLAEFGTGRMAQIIPKWAVLDEQGRVMTGFGFLHPEKTTDPQFIINNPLYFDIANNEEVVTGVEVAPVQTILDIGVIGMTLQAIFYLFLYWLIRKQRYARMYLCTLMAIWMFGLGGFAGLNQPDGLLVLGMALGIILLQNRDPQNKPTPQSVI